jgi:hypothetical protein
LLAGTEGQEVEVDWTDEGVVVTRI